MRNIQFTSIIILFLASVEMSSQSFEQELREAIAVKPKLELRMDSRHSFINQNGVKVLGVKAGIQFNDKLSFGLGYNQLWSPLEREITYRGVETKVELAYYHISPYVEYVFYRDNRWELSIPVQFGFGTSYYSRKEDAKRINQQFVVSYEPAITFQYRFLKYFGAGLGVGYRLMLKPNNEVKEKFTSPVYIFKTKIYFQTLLKDLKGE